MLDAKHIARMFPPGSQRSTRGQLVDWWILAGILGAIGLMLAVAAFAR